MAGSKIPIKKICEYCNSEFYAHKESTRYCSHTCNSRAYKQMKREAKTRTIETVEQEKKVKDIITPIRFKKRSFMSFLNRTRILSALT